MITNDLISRANEKSLDSWASDLNVAFTPDATLAEKRDAIREKIGIPKGPAAPERQEAMFKRLPMLQPPWPQPLLIDYEDATDQKAEFKKALAAWQTKMDAHRAEMMEPVTIRIQAGQKGDQKFIIVGTNGHTWQLTRNVKVEIPTYLYKQMEESIETRYEMVDINGKEEIVGFDAPSIPYQRF